MEHVSRRVSTTDVVTLVEGEDGFKVNYAIFFFLFFSTLASYHNLYVPAPNINQPYIIPKSRARRIKIL